VKSASQRRTAFAALLLAPALAACGFGAQTDQVYQAATGIDDRSGEVYLLNALIVSGADGSGTFSATLSNRSGATELTGIEGDGVTASMEPVPVAAGASVNLAEDGAVSILGDEVEAGGFVSLTLEFTNGQSTEVTVPVVRHEDEYADVPLPKRTKPAGEATDTPSAEPTE